MNFKKISLIVLIALIVVITGVVIFKGGDTKNDDNEKIQVVVSNFASYDFLRAIIGENDNVELKFLLGPGKDAHSYDPTAQDLITIQNADLFVYVGGNMEKWSEKVLSSIDNTNSKIVCIADYVETIAEQEIDGAEHSHEHNEEDAEYHDEEHDEGAFEEHIWTSPSNAIAMINSLAQEMQEIDSPNSDTYKENAENYIAQINAVDSEIQEIIDNKVRNRLIFADKMPMQYFINYYNLNVSAAFSGCSTETEPSASTIAYLENKVKEEKIPVVLYVELNDGRVAKTIEEEVGNGCQAMQIQTLHNVSLDDFNNGETWVSLMRRNIDVLRAALQ